MFTDSIVRYITHYPYLAMSVNAIAISVNVPNTVLLAAKEVLQVYVSLPWSLQICSFYSDIYVTALLQIYSFLLQSCH